MIALSYNFGLCILLIDSVIAIVYLILLVGREEFFMIMAIRTTRTSISDGSVIAVLTRFFFGYFLGLNSPFATFLFVDDFSIGLFSRSFALYSDSLMKGSLAMMTCLV